MSLMTMKTTTNTGKNQKFCRKVQESVEAIYIKSFSGTSTMIILLGAINIRIT